MANVPPLPPLVSDTPPPMEDFEEDDDEVSSMASPLTLEDEDEPEDDFGSFSLPPETRDAPPPADHSPPLSCSPPPLKQSTVVTSNASAALSNGFSPEDSEFSASIPSPPLFVEGEELPVDESHPEADCNTSPSSLKFDSLSLNSESQNLTCASSPPSMSFASEDVLSEDDVPQENNKSDGSLVCTSREKDDQVILEDIVDDSSEDESYSPKKFNCFEADEDSAEFFTIHTIAEAEGRKNSEKDYGEPKETMEIRTEMSPKPNRDSETINVCVPIDLGDNFDEDFSDFSGFQVVVPEEEDLPPLDNGFSNSFVADFSQFPELPPIDTLETEPALSQTVPTIETVDNDAEEDDFDDFQDFCTATAAPVALSTQTIPNNHLPIKELEPKVCIAEDEEEDEEEEDDFGDFAEAAFTPTTPTTSSQPSLPPNVTIAQPTLPSLSAPVGDRLKPMLEMMFPPMPAHIGLSGSECSLKPGSSGVQLDSIDTAKALDYQWTSSEMRQSLIKSLGIDARNILFGDKWNPSMPRFAANLSFDPLQPSKPTAAAANSAVADSARPYENGGILLPTRADTSSTHVDQLRPIEGSEAKEALHSREAETLYAPQSRELHPIANDQQSRFAGASESRHDAAAASATPPTFDAATTPPGVPRPAAETALSQTLPADRLSHSFVGADDATILESINDDDDEDVVSQAIIGGSGFEERRLELPQTLPRLDFDEVEDEVVTTSTYSGPLKETHIYTPSKGEAAVAKTLRNGAPMPSTKAPPIDFDYEKAAAGIIIDEAVVKKEYRDVEYNPGFGLAFGQTSKSDVIPDPLAPMAVLPGPTEFIANFENNAKSFACTDTENDEEFSDFQGVAPPPPPPTNVATSKASAVNSRTGTPTIHEEMILSPAILLPQAISLPQKKPQIEWGNAAGSIDPEELARIEELFPQPKSAKATVERTSSAETSPQRLVAASARSISATIARKEQSSAATDDDDWSDFVSVPASAAAKPSSAAPAPKLPQLYANNNASPVASPFRPAPSVAAQRTKSPPDNSNDDEWSDFVSSAPAAPAAAPLRAPPPQFNSAAWQNANFYNNPLSFYHQGGHQRGTAMPSAQKHHTKNHHHHPNHNNNNNNSSYNNNNKNNNHNNNMQQIHMMHDFSTAPAPAHRSTYATAAANNSSQFPVGSAKVAPSISLIPDLGFVSPAVPAHSTYVNALPKSSFGGRK